MKPGTPHRPSDHSGASEEAFGGGRGWSRGLGGGRFGHGSFLAHTVSNNVMGGWPLWPLLLLLLLWSWRPLQLLLLNRLRPWDRPLLRIRELRIRIRVEVKPRCFLSADWEAPDMDCTCIVAVQSWVIRGDQRWCSPMVKALVHGHRPVQGG
jgi:hypothetical protein